jgi:hypothetical protein
MVGVDALTAMLLAILLSSVTPLLSRIRGPSGVEKGKED